MPEFYLLPKRLTRKAPALSAAGYRVEVMFFRAVFSLIRGLSINRALKLSAYTFGLIGPYSDKAKKARDNLAMAFPQHSAQWRKQTSQQIFQHLGYSAVELIKLEQIWQDRAQRVEYVLEPQARTHMESKRATIFITAHVGAWQVAPLVTREYAFTTSTIYAPESNPAMHNLMLELRKPLGGKLIPSDAGPRPLIKELKQGNSIMMAMDTRPKTGKMIAFFGQDALTNTSAAGLALRTGAALVATQAVRLPNGRYRIIVHNPISSPIPDAPIKEQAIAVTEIIHRYFEQWISATPEQWICLKRRWPKVNKL